jgi:hypothetical protein
MVMDDGCVHPLAEVLPLLLSTTSDEILSWTWIKEKNHLVSDSSSNIVNLVFPFYKE